MKIEIYREENELFCRMPGQGDASLLELCIAFEIIPADQMIIKWGPKVPEIVAVCPLNEKEKNFIEDLQLKLNEKYESAQNL